MAGDIDNPTLLIALNQQIKAINDLIAGIAELATVTGNLTLTCAPELSCTPTVSPVINVSCGGVSTGSEYVSPGGDQGGTPPSGYEPPDEEIVNRRCKAANAIWRTVDECLTQLDKYDVDNLASVGATLSGALIGGLIGLAAPPFGPVVGFVVGAVAGIVTLLVSGGVDLAEMESTWTDLKSDIVCALYSGISTSGSRTAALQVLIDDGTMSTVEQQLIGQLLPTNLVNLLFFKFSDETEAAIDAETVSVVCSTACGEEPPAGWHFTADTEGWYWQTDNGTPTASQLEASPADSHDTDAGCLDVTYGTGLVSGAWYYDMGGITARAGDTLTADYYATKSLTLGLIIFYTDDTREALFIEPLATSEWLYDLAVNVATENVGKSIESLQLYLSDNDSGGSLRFDNVRFNRSA